ncbi:hypothetical protein B0T14DRAFT_503208 [Immersiella caudata]|uniref:Uncharacterized protein n=1 Tax=Immersiella caudata TaxID=314043 RepID=A0AA39XDQ2_9PEZI|nr:hypothetical protein B0T14DRAFT_503208 [Immersiella caudata]
MLTVPKDEGTRDGATDGAENGWHQGRHRGRHQGRGRRTSLSKPTSTAASAKSSQRHLTTTNRDATNQDLQPHPNPSPRLQSRHAAASRPTPHKTSATNPAPPRPQTLNPTTHP